jgi:hypothetical protein
VTSNLPFAEWTEVLGSERFCRKCNAVSQNGPLTLGPGYAAIPRV